MDIHIRFEVEIFEGNFIFKLLKTYCLHTSIIIVSTIDWWGVLVVWLLHSQYHDTYTRGSKINNNDERSHFFRKIYLSHFIRNGCERVTKGLCVRGELETEQTATYWPPIPLSLAALLSRSAGLLTRGSRGLIALFWVLVLTTASYLQLTSTNWTCLSHRVI